MGKLVFFLTLVTHYLLNLTFVLPLVLSFWYWSVTVGGLWLVLSHLCCLFLTLFTYYWWTLTCALPLVLSFWHWSAAFCGLLLVHSLSSCLFHTGQSLLVDFDLCRSASSSNFQCKLLEIWVNCRNYGKIVGGMGKL